LPAVAAGAASGLPLKDANNFLNVANIPAYTAGATSGLALVGSLMGLGNDAITAAKFDESTAFPVKSADTGTTQIARVGADSDSLETLSDQIDDISVELSPEDLQAIIDGLVEGGVTDWTVEQRAAILAAIAAIKVKTDQIGSANVTVTSPVAQSGEITIYIGNDYLLSEGRALTWVVTGVEVAFLDGAAVTLRILRAPLFYRGHEPETLEADAEFEGDVVVANEEATITVELLAADIIELDALRTGYVYQLVAKTTDNTTHTIAAGVFIAVKAIQEPSA